MKKYWSNALLLTLTGLILRAGGMVLRVYMAGQLGSEGMGLYQLVLTVYNVSTAVATSGLSMAAARMVAQMDTHRQSPAPVMNWLLRLALLLGGAACVLQFLLAKPAAVHLLGDARAAAALRALAPSLPFMAAAAVYRGGFLAKRNVRPNVVSQMVEQAARIGLVMLLLDRVQGSNIALSCVAVTAATTVSEAVSCLLMIWFYRREKSEKNLPVPQHCDTRQIWNIILPLQGDRCLSSALRAAENTLVPICLSVCIGSRSLAISQYGDLKGMALPVVLFPFSFLGALSTLLMPEITRAFTRGESKTVSRLIDRTMLLTVYIALPAAGLCTLYGVPLAQLMYHNRQVGLYLTALGPMLPFMYVEAMLDGILNGLGEQMAVFRYSLIDSVLRIAGVLLLLPRFGMQGFLWVLAVSNIATCALNVYRMLTVSRTPMQWRRWVALPLAGLVCACGAATAVKVCFPEMGETGQMLWGSTALCAVYLLLSWPFWLRELPGILHLKRQTPQAG